jgi:hypothetical protein
MSISPLVTQTVYARLLDLAWKALARHGKAWVSAASSSLKRMDAELVADLRRLGAGG